MQETQVQTLGWKDPLEKGMATLSSILAWEIPWREEPGGLQSMGSQRVRHDWATNTFILSWGLTEKLRVKDVLKTVSAGFSRGPSFRGGSLQELTLLHLLICLMKSSVRWKIVHWVHLNQYLIGRGLPVALLRRILRLLCYDWGWGWVLALRPPISCYWPSALWGSLWSHISSSHVTLILSFSITRSCCCLSSTAQGERAPGHKLSLSHNLI